LRDLVVLTAGKDDEFALRGILSRPQALGIRPIAFDIFRHSGRDGGCYRSPDAILRLYSKSHNHALVVFDREGSGADSIEAAPAMELEVVSLLEGNGWAGRAGCVVIEPELENWVWSSSPHVSDVLGWKDHMPSLRDWLVQEGLGDRWSSKTIQAKGGDGGGFDGGQKAALVR
jgi:hypothetical protein